MFLRCFHIFGRVCRVGQAKIVRLWALNVNSGTRWWNCDTLGLECWLSRVGWGNLRDKWPYALALSVRLSILVALLGLNVFASAKVIL